MKTATAEITDLELVEQPAPSKALATTNTAIAEMQAGPVAMAMQAMRAGMSIADMRGMLELQKDWEANEARKAYTVAFAAFKAEAVRIIKARQVTDGPLKGKAYAELYSVVDAVTPELSKHGLGASWSITRDEPQWLEVTCTLRHVNGHSESVSMGGPPDAGGAKNAIQARASTVTYLERYTLKAVTGVSEGGQDDDGAGGAQEPAYNAAETLRTWSIRADAAINMDALSKTRKMAGAEFSAAKDEAGWIEFKKVHAAKVIQLNAEGLK